MKPAAEISNHPRRRRLAHAARASVFCLFVTGPVPAGAGVPTLTPELT